MIWLALVVVASAGTVGFAFHFTTVHQTAFWLMLAVPYGCLAAVAMVRLRRQGVLRERLALRWGDPSVGVISGLMLLAATWFGRAQLMPPGSPEQEWLARLYWMLGDPSLVQRSVSLTLLVLFVPVCEELVWRGMVLDELAARLGRRKAWPLTALLYGLAALPTAFALAASPAGPNPLLVLAAVGCGLVWGFMAAHTKRLPAAIISHMAFNYFSVTQFRIPGM